MKTDNPVDEIISALGTSQQIGSIPSPFALPPPEPYKKSSDIAPGPQFNLSKKSKAEYRVFHQVFITYIPYRSCNVCFKKIREGEIQLPEDGYYTCPHTHLTDYVDLLNRRAREEIKMVEHERTVLKDGTIQVVVTWGEPTQNKRAQNQGVPGL